MRSACIQVIGSGEAFDSELGNTAYLLRGEDVPCVLLDCGYQVPERLWRTGYHEDLDAVFFTHLHADHAFGIVPLLTRFWEEKREKPLTLIGGPGLEAYVRKLLDLGYPGMAQRFRFDLEFLELREGDVLAWRGLSFRGARTVHSVLNLTVRVDFEDAAGVAHSFSVSGDGATTSDTRALVEDVGLHLQEIYSVDADIPSHENLVKFAEWARTSRIGTIGVAHHARSALGAVTFEVDKLRESDPRWISLKPGQVIGV
jgi:ribonuclease Z